MGALNRKDVSILCRQDPKIINQIIKQLPDNGNNQINVVLIGAVINEEAENFELLKYLQSLPEPRMENLKKRAIHAY
jgi:hypothetical protein